MGFFEDTIDGTVIYSETVQFNSPGQFSIGLSKTVTLLKIHNSGGIYQGFILGSVNIPKGCRLICSLKKTWNDYYVYKSGNIVKLESATVTISIGNTVFRKIKQYQIVK